MSSQQSVLLLGGTGRTGKRALKQLLDRGINVRIIVRSMQKLPPGVRENPHVTVTEATVLSLSKEDLQRHVRGCDAVISCLGHTISLKGIYCAPHDFVTQAARNICEAIEAVQPARPIKFILMNSVSVNEPTGLDTRRGKIDKSFLWLIRGLIPPARDNQQAVNYLLNSIGTTHPFLQWTAIRPDTLVEGEVTEYTVHENIVSSVFKPDSTNMANVADFMCELVTDSKLWNAWKGKLPVIVNASN